MLTKAAMGLRDGFDEPWRLAVVGAPLALLCWLVLMRLPDDSDLDVEVDPRGSIIELGNGMKHTVSDPTLGD